MTGLTAGAMRSHYGETDCHVAALLAMTGLGAGCLWTGLPGRFAAARRGQAPALRVSLWGRNAEMEASLRGAIFVIYYLLKLRTPENPNFLTRFAK